MDPLLRGVCEQYLDCKLKDEEVKKIRNIIDLLELPISSKEDAALGFLVGTICSHINNYYMGMYNRSPKKGEIVECHQIIGRRAEEIKLRFRIGISEDRRPKKRAPKKEESEIVKTASVTERRKAAKFRFDTNSKKQPVSNVLGIAPEEQETILIPS